MHICIIAPEQFPVPGDGSVEICIWAIARRLAERHKVTIVSRKVPGLPAAIILEQVRIIRLPASTPAHYLTSVLEYIQKESFDIIQVDNRPHLMSAVKKQTFLISRYFCSCTRLPSHRVQIKWPMP